MLKVRQSRLDCFFNNIKPDRKTGCWVWTATKVRDGYGQISLGGKRMPAHRLSYLIFRGKIKKGNYICHHCDNPPCVNPAHLFSGTSSDNRRDCFSKKRHKIISGAKHYNSKLNRTQVLEIKEFHAKNPNIQFKHSAKKYSVTRQCIRLIVKGINWKQV